MKGNAVKIIINVLAILIVFLYANRSPKSVSDELSEIYDMKVPGILKGLCIAFLIFGIVFSTILMIASKSTDTVTPGHYYIGLTCIVIGIIGFIFCMNWKVTVKPQAIVHTNIWGITKEYSKDDIENVSMGNKNELRIRFSNGTVIVDSAITNYSRLVEELYEK